MDKPIWLDEAVKMRLDEGLQYSEIVQRLRQHFPADMHDALINKVIRDAVRRSDRAKSDRREAQGGGMNYAIIENGVVVNIIVGPLPNGMDGVALGDRPVAIGDIYDGTDFYRDGEKILTIREQLQIANTTIDELMNTLAEVINNE